MATEMIPSELFSGGLGRSSTFAVPTTTHFKNMFSFCATLYKLVLEDTYQVVQIVVLPVVVVGVELCLALRTLMAFYQIIRHTNEYIFF